MYSTLMTKLDPPPKFRIFCNMPKQQSKMMTSSWTYDQGTLVHSVFSLMFAAVLAGIRLVNSVSSLSKLKHTAVTAVINENRISSTTVRHSSR